MARCLEMTARLRKRGVSQPLLLMGYFNPILAYGAARFVADAAAAGADGLIVPDLPLRKLPQAVPARSRRLCGASAGAGLPGRAHLHR